VTGLVLNASQRAVLGVQIAQADGSVTELRAKRVVLACGAVENARLLLLAGLGAGSTWLGRGFMEHARDFSLTLVPESPALFARAAFYDLNTASCGTMIGGRLSLRADAIERFDIPNAAITLIPKQAADTSSRLRQLLRRLSGSSPRARSRYGWSRQPDRVFTEFGMVLNLEQRPEWQNRVQLGDRRDRFGNQLPHLCLHWSDAEQARLDRLRGLLGEWFASAGLGSLRFERGRRPDLSAHHHAGTTRMSDRADDGVVNTHGVVFGVENLYVTGASVMPTAGFANPTLTIVALALRLAQHLSATRS
jgi:choline dehydrogenase-like flavoprotein